MIVSLLWAAVLLLVSSSNRTRVLNSRKMIPRYAAGYQGARTSVPRAVARRGDRRQGCLQAVVSWGDVRYQVVRADKTGVQFPEDVLVHLCSCANLSMFTQHPFDNLTWPLFF